MDVSYLKGMDVSYLKGKLTVRCTWHQRYCRYNCTFLYKSCSYIPLELNTNTGSSNYWSTTLYSTGSSLCSYPFWVKAGTTVLYTRSGWPTVPGTCTLFKTTKCLWPRSEFRSVGKCHMIDTVLLVLVQVRCTNSQTAFSSGVRWFDGRDVPLS